MEIETYAGIFEKVKIDNYNIYGNRCSKDNEENKKIFTEILYNYMKNIISQKTEVNILPSKIKEFTSGMIERLTGNYKIGVGDVDLEELTEHAETLSNIVAYSNKNELENIFNEQQLQSFENGIVDGAVAFNLTATENMQEEAKKNFNLSSENVKSFFKNSIYNIMHVNVKIANVIANITKLNAEESNELNTNLVGKAIGGFAYIFLSGALEKKRHFTDVTNSKSMLEKIEKEGILHFSSMQSINKIMESGKVKKSGFIESDLTKKKSFFFAGTPTFEDLLINIPAYDVMTAVRIKPTQEQIKELKYRAINDRAVVKDGEFKFSKEQAEIVYYGLMYNEEKKQIYLGELTKDEAEVYKVSDEVRKAYHFEGKKSTLTEKAKMNIYGFYAEYKHHQKLIQMEQILNERGIKNFENVNDKTLVELADIKQAYIDTKDKSIERNNLLQMAKKGIENYICETRDVEPGGRSI